MIKALFGEEKSLNKSLKDVVEKAIMFWLLFPLSDNSFTTLKQYQKSFAC